MAAAVLLLPGCLWGRASVQVWARRPADDRAQGSVGVLRCWPPDLHPEAYDVSVLAEEGRVLGHEVVWWREGTPLDLRFEAPEEVREVVVRFVRRAEAPAGQGGGAAPGWEGRAGIVLETRQRAGDAVESWEEVRQHWEQAAPILGRSEVTRIFDGIHRHGPTANFLSHYRGWLRTGTAGRHAFATISANASFLLLNGKPVAEWPGWHGLEGGRHGQHHGWVELEPGLHRIDYYHVQNDSGFSLAAAWRPPGAEAFELLPESAFEPVVRFDPFRVDAPGPPVPFQWLPEGHVRSRGALLLGMRFTVPHPEEGTGFRWRFPDGVTREGPSVLHVFPGAQIARVELEALRNGQRAGLFPARIAVAPDWSQRAEFDEQRYAELISRLSDSDLENLTPSALTDWILWAEGVEDRSLLSRLGTVADAALDRFDASSAEALYRLGFHWQLPELRRYGATRRVWTALLDLPGVARDLRGRTALHFGGMELHVFGELDRALGLLGEADRLLPEGQDRRLLEIYRGDAAVVAKRLEEAREAYWRAGNVVEAHNVHYEVRRVERMERARRFLSAGEFDAAERVIREIEWERPLERMGLETGLLLARAQRGRGEMELALQTVRRLRHLGAGDPNRAELLGLAARLLRESNAARERTEVLEELLKHFPYSEPAAMARWDLDEGS